VLGDTENPRIRGNKTKKSKLLSEGRTITYSVDDEERNPTINDSVRSAKSVSVRSTKSVLPTIKATSASMAAASVASMAAASVASMAAATEAHKSEYEHWKVDDIAAAGGGCHVGCSDGRETVAAFGEVVTEVFDLINEVAFPEVIDLVTEAEEKENDRAYVSDSYRDDDDSVFNRSREYGKSKQAKEFLGYIGAVKPSTKKIITTPAAPVALLTPCGVPLNLPQEVMSIVDVKRKKGETRNGNDNNEDNCHDDDNSILERSRSHEKSLRSRDRQKVAILDDSYSSEDSINGEDDDKDNQNWSYAESKTRTKDVFKKAIVEDVVNETKDASSSDELASNSVAPFTMSSAARIQSAIAQNFTRAKPKYAMSPSVCSSDQSELLTIAESSDEDAYTSEDEDNEDAREEVQHQDKVEHAKEVDLIVEMKQLAKIQQSEEVEPKDKMEHLQEAKCEDECKEGKGDKTIGNNEEGYCSSVSESSYSSYNDGDETYVTSLSSDDDSFLDDSEDESITSHTRVSRLSVTSHSRNSLGVEDQSVTYSIGAQDSLLNEEEDCDVRISLSDGSSDDDDDKNVVENKASIAESLLAEEDEEGELQENDTRTLTMPSLETSFCSVYDSLYPVDSLFSFKTQDETIFDFQESGVEQGIQKPPPSIITDQSTEESPSSALTGKNSDDENEDKKEVVPQEDQQLQQDEAKIEEIVDSNCDDPRDEGIENRDCVDEEKIKEDSQRDSQISSPFESDLYGQKRQPSDIPKHTQCFPPAPHPAALDELPTNLSPETISEEGKGNSAAKDEDSNSNSSIERTDVAEITNSKTATDNNKNLQSGPKSNPNNADRQLKKRRQLSRLKMYNKHRKNILMLQTKAE